MDRSEGPVSIGQDYIGRLPTGLRSESTRDSPRQ